MSRHTALKYPQCHKALECTTRCKESYIHTDDVHRLEVYEELKALKHNYPSVEIDKSKFTWPYIAGLFDAEGCVLTSGVASVNYSIAQAQAPQFMEALASTIDHSYVKTRKEVYIYTRSSFLEKVHKYSVQKAPQVKAALSLSEISLIDGVEGNEEEIDLLRKLIDDQKHKE